MSYGTIKVDTITFTDNGSDVSVSVSGLAKNPTISGDLTVTGTISGTVVQGGTTVSGATVTGTTANFVSGVYTTQISGATITGNAGQFTTLTGGTAGFTTVTGTTVTGTTANFVSGVFTTQVSGATITGDAGEFTTLTGGTAGFTTVTGTTVTGTTANFVTVSGTTVTGNAGNFTTATVTSGVFASGTAAAPSVSVGTTDNGLYSPGTDQVALATNGTGRLFIDSSGRVGVFNAQTPLELLHVKAGNSGIETDLGGVDGVIIETGITRTAGLLFYTPNDRPAGIIFNDSDGFSRGYLRYDHNGDYLHFAAAGSERLRIDSDGRLLVGTSSNMTGLGGFNLQVAGGVTESSILQACFNAGTGGPIYRLYHSRNAALDGHTIVQNNDKLGRIVFAGSDGTNPIDAAEINAEVDGTPGANDMPGRLTFSVTADGASSPTEALRISSDRSIKVSDGGDVVLGTTTGTKIGTSTSQKIGFYNATPVVQPTTGVAEAAFVENSGGTAVNVDSTFGGYTIQQVVEALQTLGLLA